MANSNSGNGSSSNRASIYSIVGTAHEVQHRTDKNGRAFITCNVMTVLRGAPAVRQAFAFGPAVKSLADQLAEGGTCRPTPRSRAP